MPRVNRRQFLQSAAAAAVAAPFVGVPPGAPPQRRLRPLRRPSLGLHGRCRASVSQDAQHRPDRERGHPVLERVLHEFAVLAEPRQLPQRALRAQPSGHQQLHRVSCHHSQLSAAPPRRGLPHGLYRQMAHGRGQRREAPGIRLLGEPQGPGSVLRHAVQRRRPPSGHQGLLRARRHEPGNGLAENGAAAVFPQPGSQGAARAVDPGAEIRARLR